MSIFESIVNKILFLEKEPQKIGLSQVREPMTLNDEPSIKSKNVKLSDLMRRSY